MQVWLQFSSQRTEEVCVFVCVSERRQYFLEGKKERRNVVICWCDWKWEQVSPPLRFYRMGFIPFCKFSKRSVLFTMIELFFHLQHQLNAFHLSISSILAFHSPAPWTGDAVAVAMVVVARWLLLEAWRYFFNWGKIERSEKFSTVGVYVLKWLIYCWRPVDIRYITVHTVPLK